MQESAGLLVIHNNKMLLVHPTNAPWYGTYSIPKGKLEKGETYIDAAIRETKEETGIKIKLNEINKTPYKIQYKNEKGKIYKELTYFLVNLNYDIKIDKNKLQLNEIDWAGFVDKDEAISRIFWRFEEMLKFLD
ncbi:MAG: NUDIX hydrolase [Saccharofermentanales bacterium]